eukprot:gnl/TRDRNA2_/TRDRNA2_140683_c1_seq1.p1 gnl/TRDRNA2_/TRDRNA2_140683_c1~~gnl/TRDRNA2_/TRDRNA2_140683_c1_seq1.p1  ORF type:complete len:546 (+),score=81.76 gnl/TRDRNA2_/TRDRNA2_140683_c1_seq1:35-1672(+)
MARVAPGGSSTLSLNDGSASENARRPIAESTDTTSSRAAGGAATIDRAERPMSARRPMGGTSTLSLSDGNTGSPVQERPMSARRPVGGASTLSLGNDAAAAPRPGPTAQPARATPSRPAAGAASNSRAERPMSARRRLGGASTISLAADPGAHVAELPKNSVPVGGATAISLGSEASADRFAHCKAAAQTPLPDAKQRFTQAPGGSSTISLSGSPSKTGTAESKSAKSRPVGGNATISLGGEPPKPPMSARAVGGETTISLSDSARAPARPLSARRAVGGDTTISLSDSARAPARPLSARRAIGGDTTISLSDSARAPARPTSARRAAGPSTTISLGSDAAAPTERPKFAPPARGAAAGVPSVPPSARGNMNTSTLSIGGDHTAPAPTQPASAGHSEITAGSEDAAPAVTTAAPPRFSQAPGGTDSICFDDSNMPSLADPAAAKRSPYTPNGKACKFSGRAAARTKNLQAPGGTTSISLGEDKQSISRASQERQKAKEAKSIASGVPVAGKENSNGGNVAKIATKHNGAKAVVQKHLLASMATLA